MCISLPNLNVQKQILKSQIVKIQKVIKYQKVKLGVWQSARRRFGIIPMQESYRENFFISLHDEIADLANDFFTVLFVSNRCVFLYQI